MNRQCPRRWAALLMLVATVSLAPLPARFSAPVTSALAQGDAPVNVGEPADLAIAALHCAEAPASEALTPFFATGAAPSGCSPAAGVTISVSENGAPVPSSPSTTDVDGIVVLPVSLGSALEVREDPASLPSGYEPLTQEANGVPYANPVQIDSAVAGAAVLFVNVPRSTTELAQDAPADAVSEPIDLAVVALQCAAAPEAETLTSFFGTGIAPGGCSLAVGVGIAVMEHERPLPGSPFTTDADGTLSVPVTPGAAVSVKEAPVSWPGGYAPLTQAANGVPYANPVKLDAATAGTAVLFVNVPSSVAVTQGRTGCDPAYPDARTCIAPGRPLAAPCSITDQRNFTVLAPDPRGLDADHDGLGCEPVSPRGSAITLSASVTRSSSGSNRRRAAPVSTGTVPVVAPSRTGNVAIVSNPVFIANGMWGWPNRFNRDDWIWRQRNSGHVGVGFLPGAFNVGNVVLNGGGSGSIAIASNPIFISNGAWAWPDHRHGDDWLWRTHPGNGAWSWPNWSTPGNVTVASSGGGSGKIAIVSNPVFISSGVWHWPGHANTGGWLWNHGRNTGLWRWPNHYGNSDWIRPGIINVGNLVIARSGNNIAIVSNPIVIISGGLWYVPPGGNHDDDWYDHGDRDHDRDHADAHLMQSGAARAEHSVAEAQANAGDVSAASPGEIELLASSEQPTLTVNGGLAVEPAPADPVQLPSDVAEESPIEVDQAASDGDVTLPGEGAIESPGDGTVAAPLDTGTPPQAEADVPDASEGAADSGYVEPAYVDPGYGEIDYVDPGYVEPPPTTVDSAADPGYVAPEPSYVEPSYVDTLTVDAGYVAPDPVIDPSYSEPQPSSVDPGFDVFDVAPEPNLAAPEPVYVAPEPSYVDSGNGAANPGMDAVFGGQEPNSNAPEPNFANPGMDTGNANAGTASAGNLAPDPGMDDAGNADPGLAAADFGGGG